MLSYTLSYMYNLHTPACVEEKSKSSSLSISFTDKRRSKRCTTCHKCSPKRCMDSERCNVQKLHLRYFNKANEGKHVLLRHSYRHVDKTGHTVPPQSSRKLTPTMASLLRLQPCPGITHILIFYLKSCH